VILDHRVGEQIAAKFAQFRFLRLGVALQLDLEITTDAHVARRAETEMLHRLAHRSALGVEHGLFRCHDHFYLHAPLLSGQREAGSKKTRISSRILPQSAPVSLNAGLTVEPDTESTGPSGIVALSPRRKAAKVLTLWRNRFSQAKPA